MNLDLGELRVKIDEIDSKIIDAVTERMRIAGGIAKYKKENGLPILDAEREKEKLDAIASSTEDEFKEYMQTLFTLIMNFSKEYQRNIVNYENDFQPNAEED